MDLELQDSTIRMSLPPIGSVSNGIGTQWDKSRWFTVNQAINLSKSDCYELIEGSELLREIVTAYPTDALRLSPIWNLTDTEIESGDIAEALESIEFIDNADTVYYGKDAFKQAQIVANIEGNAYLWIDVEDGLDYQEPLDFSRILSIKGGYLFGTTHVTYQKALKNLQGETIDGGYYQISVNPYVAKVHRSRIIRFEGVSVTSDRLIERSYKNPSLLQTKIDAFINFTGTVSDTRNYIKSCSLFFHKMKGLATLAVQKKSDDLRNRFALIQQMVGSIGGYVIDADAEDMGFVNRNFGGLDKLLEIIESQFVAVSGLTRGRLFKQSNQGAMSESGKSDDRQWANMVAQYQADVITPKLNQITDIILSAKRGPTNGMVVPYSITYPSILPEDNKAKAEIYKLYSEADKNYFDMGLSGETIISSRFEGTEFGTNITLDDDYMREESQTAMIEPQDPPNEPEDRESEIEDASSKIQIPYEEVLTDTDYDSILALLERGEVN